MLFCIIKFDVIPNSLLYSISQGEIFYFDNVFCFHLNLFDFLIIQNYWSDVSKYDGVKNILG